MKTLITLFIALFICQNIFSQHKNEFQRKIIELSSKAEKSESHQTKSSVSVYLNNSWQLGTVTKKDSTIDLGKYYRYDIQNDRIEYMSFLSSNENNKVVTVGKTFFVYSTFLKENKIEEGYFELLVNDDCKLLLRRETKYVQMTMDVKAYGSSSSNNISMNYYIKKGNEPAKIFKPKKNELLTLLSDKEQEIEEFINENRFFLLNKKKLIKIVKYYNSLINDNIHALQ